MKTILMMAVLLQASFAVAAKGKVTKEVLAIDSANSKITWLGKKIKGEHTGGIAVKEGTIEYKNDKLVAANLAIDINSITNTDLTDKEYNEKLVNHLKGEDFFHASKYPTATINVTSLEEIKNAAAGEPNAIVKGKMTIRGKTEKFENKVFYTMKDGKAEIKGKMEIDRTKFGLNYSSKKFFSLEKLGDKMIEDMFTVDLNLVAMKK